MRVALLFLLLTASGFSQDVPEKRTGEDIFLQACGAEGDTVRFYQQVNHDSTPVAIGAMVRIPGETECKEIIYRMPGGNAEFLRFYAVPSIGSEMLNSTNGERVKRKERCNAIAGEMKKLLLILPVLLWASSLQAQVALDSTTSVASASAATTFSLTGVAVGSHSNRFLLVKVFQREPNTNNVTGCTFNTSETMTKLSSLGGSGGTNLNVSWWYRLAPSVTTASVDCTSSNAGRVVMGSLSLYNVNQASPFRDQSGANFLQTAVSGVTTASVTLATVAGDYCIAGLGAGNNVSNVTNLVPGGTQAEQWDVPFQVVTNARGGGSTFVATGTSTAMSYTWTNNEVGVLIAAAVRATSGTALFTQYYKLLRN